MKNNIKAEIIAHSKRAETGEEIITYKLTFPRIILSEVNTYKQLEKNTSSCLPGNTKIMVYNKKENYLFERPIRLIYQDFINNEIDYGIISYDEDKNVFFLNEIKEVFSTGVKEVFGLGNEHLNYLECTKEHKLFTGNGWITTEQFIQNKNKGIYQVLYRLYESHQILNINSEKNYLQWREVPKRLATKTLFPILNVRNEGKKETYDIEVKGEYHNFLANNIIVHNSRAIPFEKMVEVVEKEPFVPLAWQLSHKGMQGTKYLTDPKHIEIKNKSWLRARDKAVTSAKIIVGEVLDTIDEKLLDIEISHATGFIPNTSLSKNYGNRLLEPFMWVTQLITGTRESFEHLFEQRCPIYNVENLKFNSKKEALELLPYLKDMTDLEWLQCNSGQAEIHFMDLAEKMYDALNESTPKELYSEEWHIPFREEILKDKESKGIQDLGDLIKMSVCLTAKISYTKIGDENTITIEKAREMYERLKNSGHWSCFGHIAKCMANYEYETWIKGKCEKSENLNILAIPNEAKGFNKNLRGFISLRQYVEDDIEITN
jgi:hypothetical protein